MHFGGSAFCTVASSSNPTAAMARNGVLLQPAPRLIIITIVNARAHPCRTLHQWHDSSVSPLPCCAHSAAYVHINPSSCCRAAHAHLAWWRLELFGRPRHAAAELTQRSDVIVMKAATPDRPAPAQPGRLPPALVLVSSQARAHVSRERN